MFKVVRSSKFEIEPFSDKRGLNESLWPMTSSKSSYTDGSIVDVSTLSNSRQNHIVVLVLWHTENFQMAKILSLSAYADFITWRCIQPLFHRACLIYIMIYSGPLSKKNPGSALGMDPYPFCLMNDRMMSLTCVKFEGFEKFRPR